MNHFERRSLAPLCFAHVLFGLALALLLASCKQPIESVWDKPLRKARDERPDQEFAPINRSFRLHVRDEALEIVHVVLHGKCGEEITSRQTRCEDQKQHPGENATDDRSESH